MMIRVALSLIEDDSKPPQEFAAKVFVVPERWSHIQEVTTHFQGLCKYPQIKETLRGPEFRMVPEC